MSKRFLILAAAVLTMALPASPAYADLAHDIADASDGNYAVSDSGSIYSLTGRTGYGILDMAVEAVTRVCDGADAEYIDGNSLNGISAGGIAEIGRRKAYVDGWIAANIQAIVPDGTGRGEAIRRAFEYIAGNYPYDYACLDDIRRLADAQGAYYALVNGRGVCASYSKLFRGMVEALPFNADGNVDYSLDAASASHIRVALVRDTGGEHEWTSIQDADGTWYYYDITRTVYDRSNGNGYAYLPDGTAVDLAAFHLTDSALIGRTGYGRDGNMVFEY